MVRAFVHISLLTDHQIDAANSHQIDSDVESPPDAGIERAPHWHVDLCLGEAPIRLFQKKVTTLFPHDGLDFSILALMKPLGVQYVLHWSPLAVLDSSLTTLIKSHNDLCSSSRLHLVTTLVILLEESCEALIPPGVDDQWKINYVSKQWRMEKWITGFYQ